MIELPKTFTCAKCGNENHFLEARNHKGALKRGSSLCGKYYCAHCIHKMSANMPDKKFSRQERLERIICRASRGGILSPDDVIKLAEKWMPKIGGRVVYKEQWSAGYIDGRPIAILESDNFDNAREFWQKVRQRAVKRNTEKAKTRLFFAVMMLILGDKNAVKYC